MGGLARMPLAGPRIGMLYRNHVWPTGPSSIVPDRRNRLAPGSVWPGTGRGLACRFLGADMTGGPIRLIDATLRRGGRDLVRDLTGVFAQGSLTAVAGPNGAGKSTLLHALRGTFPVDSGRIDRGVLGPSSIALLPQEGRLDRSFPVSCRDVVALGWTARIGLFRRIGPNHYDAADRALASVGLDGWGHQSIGALSAGQFQRVLFARTIVCDAPVILLDEPFSAVDAATEADLMEIVRAWHKQGRTVVAVLHDLDLIRAEFPETLLLGSYETQGWGATGDILTVRAARQARLRASIPSLASNEARPPVSPDAPAEEAA